MVLSLAGILEIRMPKTTSRRHLLPETTICRVSPFALNFKTKILFELISPYQTKQVAEFKNSNAQLILHPKKRGTQNPSRFLVGGFKPSEKY